MTHEDFNALGEIARSTIASVRSSTPDNKAGAGEFDPVTEADRAAETALRDEIAKRFPEDGIWGEEHGWTRQCAARHWSIDPIDGTRAFICGLPNWAVLVGVLEHGRTVAGMIDLPVLDERLVAVDGRSVRNGTPVRTSDVREISGARLATTDENIFGDGHRQGFARLREAALVTRLGLDALAYARVATGDIDLVAETGLKTHDYDGPVAVVRGAGGHVGNWSGGDDLSGGDIVAAASEALYREAVALLAD